MMRAREKKYIAEEPKKTDNPEQKSNAAKIIRGKGSSEGAYKIAGSLKAEAGTSSWQVLPSIFVMAVVPLLVRAVKYKIGLAQYAWFDNREENWELFLKFKQQALGIAGVIMLLIISYHLLKVLFKGKEQRTKKTRAKIADFGMENGVWKWDISLFPLLAYLALALLSTLLSTYASYGYSGAHEQFESLFVLLTYGMIVIYTFWAISGEKSMKALEIGFLCGVSLLCILGLLQFSGNDLFRTKLGVRMILPSELYERSGGNLQFNFPLNQVYLSLYNPNYVGQYVSLVLPVIAALFINCSDKKMRLWYGLLILGLLICLVGSGSKTAFITLIFTVILMLLLFRKKLLQNKRMTALGLSGAAVFIAAMVLFMGNSFFERLRAALQFPENPDYALSAMTADKDKIRLTYKGETAELIADSEAAGGFRLFSESGQEIATRYDERSQTYFFENSSFSEIPLQIFPDGEGAVEMKWTIEHKDWHLYYEASGFYYVTGFNKADRMVEIEKGLFQKHESFATYRGYIWSRTMPLLKKYFFLGAGADSFTLVFPQHDYLGKAYNRFEDTLITRPHNFYLQVAVQTGVLSMLSVLAFYILYLLQSLKLYWKGEFDDYFSRIGAAVLIGSLGYMVSSVFNDSTITVAPVFWGLMGVGLAMNHQVKIRQSEKKRVERAEA